MSKRLDLFTRWCLPSARMAASMAALAGPASVSQSKVNLVRVDKSGKGCVVVDSPVADINVVCSAEQQLS